MKLTLVVASGVHRGKPIAVPGTQFVIGRDEGCHLRPASPAVSKKHCVLYLKGAKWYAKDLGSTNGTFVDDEQITGEHEVRDGSRLKVGPLDFTISISASKTDSTPLPDALKAVNPPAAGAKPGSSTVQKPVAAPAPPPRPAPDPDLDADAAAALLLGTGDEEPGADPQVPGGSTVMELPAVDAEKLKAEADKDKKKGSPSAAETSAAASEILRRYMRRPR